MYTFCYWFLLYFMYCVLGYILECTFCSIIDKKVVLNRGFLIGPYLPIYGKGAICIILLLNKYLKDPILQVTLWRKYSKLDGGIIQITSSI